MYIFWIISYKFGAYIERLGHFLNNLVLFMISRHDILTQRGKVSAKLTKKFRRNLPKTARFCDILTVAYKIEIRIFQNNPSMLIFYTSWQLTLYEIKK